MDGAGSLTTYTYKHIHAVRLTLVVPHSQHYPLRTYYAVQGRALLCMGSVSKRLERLGHAQVM
jgi:hypothetical protein